MFVFFLGVMFVFLVLAAQYESWSLPLAVILVVPMCLLCSVSVIVMAGMEVNIFTQIGFVVLVGLASKNAILIVEFAKVRSEAGEDPWQATMEAARLRLRPILMTSFAFILGVVPLALATGAGARCAARWAWPCSAACSASRMFGIFLTPVFYYVIQKYFGAAVLPPQANQAARQGSAGRIEARGPALRRAVETVGDLGGLMPQQCRYRRRREIFKSWKFQYFAGLARAGIV